MAADDLRDLLEHLHAWRDLYRWNITYGFVDERKQVLENSAGLWKDDRASYRVQHENAEALRLEAIKLARHLEVTSSLLEKVAPELVDQLPVVDFFGDGSRLDSAKLAASVRKVIALVSALAAPAAKGRKLRNKAPANGKPRKPGRRPVNAALDAIVDREWKTRLYRDRHQMLKRSAKVIEAVKDELHAERAIRLSMERIRKSHQKEKAGAPKRRTKRGNS